MPSVRGTKPPLLMNVRMNFLQSPFKQNARKKKLIGARKGIAKCFAKFKDRRRLILNLTGFLFFACSGSGSPLFASCVPDTIFFYSQQDIDDFAVNYPGCTEIEGHVVVNELTPGSITNLQGLAQITSIGGDLFLFYNTNLTSLAGLENLSYVGGNLSIWNCHALENLDALAGLTQIGGSLEIVNNNALINFSGLEALAAVGQHLKVSGNASLENFSGLEGLEYIGGLVSVSVNEALQSLSGLENVAVVGTSIMITNNTALQQIDAFHSLTSYLVLTWIADNPSLKMINAFEAINTTGEIYIGNNPLLEELSAFTSLDTLFILGLINNSSLQNLSSLDNLHSVLGEIVIQGNDALEDMQGLNNLVYVHTGLFVDNNASLQSLQGLNQLEYVGHLSISNNPSLESLNGLNQLKTAGSLEVSANPMLVDFSGLGLLKKTDKMFVLENESLVSLDGLEALDSLSAQLYIHGNTMLSDLYALEQTAVFLTDTTVGLLNYLSIADNPMLSDCAIQGVCDYLSLPQDSTYFGYLIENNLGGCNSKEEVLDACASLVPACTELLEPAPGSENVSVAPLIHWAPAWGAEGYWISVGTYPGGSDLLDSLNVGNATAYQLEELPCGSTIYLRVWPYNLNGVSDFCEEYSFTTTTETEDFEIVILGLVHLTSTHPGAIYVMALGDGTYSYAWSGPSGFSSTGQNATNLAFAGCYNLTVTDAATQCKRDTILCIENLTGEAEVEAGIDDWRIYPNPFGGTALYVNLPKGINTEKAHIRIFDVYGRSYEQKQLVFAERQLQIRLPEGMPPGLYFLQVVYEGHLFELPALVKLR